MEDCIHLRQSDAEDKALRAQDIIEPPKVGTVFYCGVHFRRMCESCFNEHMSNDWRNELQEKPPNFREDALPVDLLYERKMMPYHFGGLREALIPRVFTHD